MEDKGTKVKIVYRVKKNGTSRERSKEGKENVFSGSSQEKEFQSKEELSSYVD